MLADRIGEELEVPVFLYGELTATAARRARARVRSCDAAASPGSPSGWRDGPRRERRLRPDFGPPRMHPTAGATLVAARQPLVAFNLQLAAPADARGRARDRRADPRGRRGGPAGRARDRGCARAAGSRRSR